MPIQTKCEHCGFAYISKDEMIGKKVRCRNCGQVFAVAPPSESRAQPTTELPPETRDEAGFPAVTMQESNMSGGIGSAKSRMERSGEADPFAMAGEAPGELSRPATPFGFPYAGLIDALGPRILTFILLLWVGYALFSWAPWDRPPNPSWAGIIPVALALLLFVALWIPLIRSAIRQVSRTMLFSLPEGMGMRTAAVASLPFALAGLFWLAGESVVTFGIGALLGSAIAVPVAIFVYRLREMEIAHGAMAVIITSLISAAGSAGVFAAANYFTAKALESAGHASVLDHSPYGPEFSWPEPIEIAPTPTRSTAIPTPPAEIRPQPQPITPIEPIKPPTAVLPQDGQGTPEVQPQPEPAPQPPVTRRQPETAPELANPLANHALLTESRVLQVPVAGGQIVYPLIGAPLPDGNGSLTPINHFAVVTTSPAGDDVSVFRIRPFRQVHPPKPFAATVGGYALSPDGDLLARATRFGGPTVQVWSYRDDRVVATFQVDREPQLLAFTDRAVLLCGWRNSGAAMELAAYDLTTQKWIDYVLSQDPHGQWVSPIWAGGKLSLLTLGTDVRSGIVSLRVYPPIPGRSVFAPIMRREAAQALSPSAIAPSPDGTQLAVAFEQEGQLQIAIFKRPDKTPVGPNPDLMVRNHIFPGGLDLKAQPADAARQGELTASTWLTWLPGVPSDEQKEVSGVLFYKQLAIDPDQGRLLDRIPIPSVTAQKALSSDTIHFIVPDAAGPRIIEGKLPTQR